MGEFMGTPLKPTDAADRMFPATEPDADRRVEPLPPAASPSPSSPQFRRAFPRIPCRVLVDYVVDGKAYRDCIANISEGGAFIETCHPLRVGRPITLSFTLFQDQQPLRVAGEVVWSNATGAGVKLPPNAAIGQFCAKQSDLVEEPLDEAEETAPPSAPPSPVAHQAAKPADRRRTGTVSAVVVPSIALIIVAMMGVLARYDTRAGFTVLDEKIDRLSHDWARVEEAVARHLEESVRKVPEQTTAPSATTQSNGAPARGSFVAPQPEPPVSVDRGRVAPTTPPASSDSAKPAAMISNATAADPAPGASATALTQPLDQDTVYVVERGDTLFRIGMKFNLSTKALVDFNQLASADTIYVGQRIRIPTANGR